MKRNEEKENLNQKTYFLFETNKSGKPVNISYFCYLIKKKCKRKVSRLFVCIRLEWLHVSEFAYNCLSNDILGKVYGATMHGFM